VREAAQLHVKLNVFDDERASTHHIDLSPYDRTWAALYDFRLIANK